MKVFVGYDPKEDDAYQVCEYSIKKHQPSADVIPLVQSNLRALGLYTRPVDPLSSTEFTFTRFLVPALMNYQGWAVFCDCDFLWLDDIQKLYDQRDDRYAAMVVKHQYAPVSETKMDNCVQYQYPRKNWSSLILWNCGHPSNRYMVPEAVNTETGQFLHRFQWIRDHYLGELGCEWNWLVNWYKETVNGQPCALHYTEGGPWFDNYKSCEYADTWRQYQLELKELTL